MIKRKIYLKIILGIATIVLLIKLISIIFVEPWVGKKIQATLNDKKSDFIVEIDKVRILMIVSGIELENITIYSKREHDADRELDGKIASVKFKGFNFVKFLVKNDIYISNIIISNGNIKGKIPLSREGIPPVVSTFNIRINKILFDKTDLKIENTLNAQSFSLKEGVLRIFNLHFEKEDTLFPGIVEQFDFEAKEFVSVSPDSMYSFAAGGIIYSAALNTLMVNSFSIQPNYAEYDFISRHEFQTDRIEAIFDKIYVYDFNTAGYFRSESLISSYIEIRKMNMKVFRDLRKEFRHVNKPAFQDIIYNYPGAIQIDSIGLLSGNITYTEHDEAANEPGSINFNEINAKIYKITNNTIYKTENASLKIKGDALLMGKGKMTILFEGRIFDNQNTFTIDGTLSGMEANELNPILEKNAYIYATSGKIDAMNFSFTANNTKATGKMILLYHGLDITVKNNRTDDTTAFKERFISFIINRKVLDSNPIPDEEVREGFIDYERDTERFLFNYCFKSILSGIKNSLAKNQKNGMNS